MINFGSPPPETGDEAWKYRLDRFALDYGKELAALAWGFWLEQGAEGEMLGIDLKPAPHFVSYSRTALNQLNRNTNGQLQEILGLIDGHQPEREVLYLAIGDGQIKLINFAPEPPPPVCFEEVATDISVLIEELEAHLSGMGH